MVAIVLGSNLGIFDSTFTQQNGQSSGALGQSGGQAYVNASNGNLVLQFSDETLSGTGKDLNHLRTYNSLGSTTDGDADRWRWLGEKRLVLTGDRNKAGSYITRTTGDGHSARFDWDGSKYVSSDGVGAHDFITWSSSPSQWVYTEGTTRVVETYNRSTGWIRTLRDSSGNGFNYTFSGDKLTSVKDSRSGQTLNLVYGSNGKLARLETKTTASGSLTKQVYYSYDSRGRLTKVTTDLTPSNNSISDNKVYVTNYTYDGTSLRVASISQSDGTKVDITYQSIGGQYRVKTLTDEAGKTTFTYDLSNRRTDILNGAGETWSYFYDSAERLTKVQSTAVNGVRQSASYSYDSKDNVIKVTDGRGNAISYKYDSNGNKTEEKDALGNTVRYTYNSANKITTQTRFAVPSSSSPGAPQTTRYVYDSKYRLRYVVSAEGRVSENQFDQTTGLTLKSIRYTGGKYNVSNLSVTATLSESQLNTWRNGQSRAKSELTQFSYDYRGNLTKKTEYGSVDSNGNGVNNNAIKVTEYVHDEYGNLRQEINVRNSTKTTIFSYAYDGLGRQISKVSAGSSVSTAYSSGKIVVSNQATGLVSTSIFDARGKLTSMTQSGSGANRVYTYKYDAAGRLRMAQDPTGARNYIFYDKAGRTSFEVDATGSVKGYAYDADGRVTSERYYANRVNTSSWYSGGTVTVTSPGVSANSANDRITTHKYDKSGRLVSTTQSSLSEIKNSFDGASRVTKVVQGSHISRYFYDKDGRKVGALNAERYFSEYIYDGAGRLTQMVRYANQVSTSLQGSGNFSGIRNSVVNGGKLRSYYFYDAQGRQTGAVDETGFLTRTIYEPKLNRRRELRYLNPMTVSSSDTLSSVISKGGSYRQTTYQYDDFGKLIDKVGHDSTRTRHIYDSAGRLVQVIEAQGTSDERISRTRYNAFSDVTGMVGGVGSATLPTAASQSQINTAITSYGKRYVVDAVGRKVQELGANGQKALLYYNSEGQLLYRINAKGEVSKTTYNAFGEVASVRVYTGRISLSGLVGGKVTSTLTNRINAIANNSIDSTVSYQYTRAGFVSRVTDSEGFVSTKHYNGYGQLTDHYKTISGSNTIRTHYDYNKLDKTIKVTKDHGGINAAMQTKYDGYGRVVQLINPNGKVTKTAYQDNGRTIVVTDPLNRSVKTQYDAFGRKLKVWDGFNKVTSFAYDDVNRKFTVTTPEGVVVTTWRTRTGEVLKVKDGRGSETAYTYDKNGRLLTVKDGLGNTSSNKYDHSGRLVEAIDANGNLVRHSYDSVNRLFMTAIDPNGLNIRTQVIFDGQGRQIKVTKGYGTSASTTTEYKYDRNSRLKQIIVDPAGLKLSTRYSYDGVGNKIKVERGTASSPSQQVTEYTFDKLGRKTKQVRDPAGIKATTQYRYDKAGHLTRVINARGHSTWFVYNAAGQKIRKINAQGGVTAYGYDKNGRQHHIRHFYNKLSSSTVSGFGDVISGAPAPSANGNDRRTYRVFDYDGRERYVLSASSGSNWTISEKRYDKSNNIVETRQYSKYLHESRINAIASAGITREEVSGEINTLFPSGLSTTVRTHYAYDANNRLRFTVDGLGYVTENKYDNNGNIRYQTFFNGKPSLSNNYSEGNINNKVNRSDSANRTSEYFYDRASRLVKTRSSIANSYYGSSTTVLRGRLEKLTTYDALGQVTSIEEGRVYVNSSYIDTQSSRKTFYVYDKAGRQIKTTLAGYYDRIDGRFHKSNASDRYARTVEVSYDAFGNATRNKITYSARYYGNSVTGYNYVYQHKTYDKLNRVIHDIDVNGNVTKNTYDVNGNLTKITRHYNKLSVRSTPWTVSSANSGLANSSNDRTITQTFDSLNQKTKVLMPQGSQNYETRESYSSTYGEGTNYSASGFTTYSYNAFGELVKSSQRINRTGYAHTYIYYDRSGRDYLTIDAEKYGTRKTYDVFGNVYRITEYAKRSSTSNLSSHTAPSFTGTGSDRKTRFTYDALGQQTSVIRENIKLYSSQYGENRTYTRTVSQSKYNAFGEVVETKDALGNKTALTYDTLGRVTKIVEPERRIASTGNNPFSSQVNAKPTTYYYYNAFGDVLKQTRSTNAGLGATLSLRYSYDAIGNRISSVDGKGLTTYFKFDGNARMISQRRNVNVAGTSAMNYNIEKQYVYDKVGRQTHAVELYTDHTGSRKKSGIKKEYNQFGELTYVRNIWGNISQSTTSLSSAIQAQYVYDKAGRVRYSRDSSAGYTYYFYDLADRVTKTEVRGNTTSASGARNTYFYYDKQGRVLNQRLPVYTGTYSALSAATKTLRPVIKNTYDRWGNVLTIKDVTGQTTSFTYNHNNQVLSELSTTYQSQKESGSTYNTRMTREKFYDVAGRLVREKYTARDGSTVTASKSASYSYNKVGQIERYTDSTNKSTYYTYDIHGNKVATRNGVGTVHVDQYDRNNQLIAKYVVRGSTKKRLAYYYYDQAGRKYRELDAANKSQYYKYDERGKLTKHVMHVGTKNYRYDVFGNKTYQSQAITGTTLTEQWAYSASSYTVGRKTSHTHVNGNRATFSYDRFGQVAKESVSSKNYKEYTYWQNGLLRKVTDVYIDGTKGWAVEKSPYSYHKKSKTSEFIYDIRGNRSVEKYNTRDEWETSKREYYGGHSSGFPQNYRMVIAGSGSKSSAKTTLFSYDALGRLERVKSPKGSFVTHNGATPTTYVGAEIVDLTYKYDEYGNRRSIKAQYKQPNKTNTESKLYYYKYDNEGRMLIEDGYRWGNKVVAGKNGGTAHTYDQAGRRATSEKWTRTIEEWRTNTYGGSTHSYLTPVAEQYEQTRYTYNDLGLVKTVSKRNNQRNAYATTALGYKSTGSYHVKETHTYDDRGFKTQSVISGKKSVFTYDDAGRMKKKSDYNSSNKLTGITDYKSYHSTGDLIEMQYRHYDNGSYKFTETRKYDYVKTYAGYKNSKITVTSTQNHTGMGTTFLRYNHRGQLVYSSIRKQDGWLYKYFAHDAEGQIVGKVEKEGSNRKIQSYFLHGTHSLADIGNERVNVKPVNSLYQGGATPGSYTVREGDTLASIAHSYFGDVSLWYVIADANGLLKGPSDAFSRQEAGTSLRIPNSNQNVSNKATSFRPYNPGDAIGDLSPSTVFTPPPPKKKSCQVVAIILIAVVAVVATVVTAGAAAAALGATAAAGGGIFGTGAAVLTGGALVATGTTTAITGLAAVAITMGAAAVGGIAGSLASQGVSMAFGMQEELDWKAAFASGLTSSLTAGFGSVIGTGSNTASLLAKTGRAALTATASESAGYVSNKIFGLEAEFNWKSIATAAAKTLVMGGVLKKEPGPKNFLKDLGGGLAKAGAKHLSNKIFNKEQDTPFYLAAADAFGNALGNTIVREFDGTAKARRAVKKLELDTTRAQNMELEGLYKDAINHGMSAEDAEKLVRNQLRELKGDFLSGDEFAAHTQQLFKAKGQDFDAFSEAYADVNDGESFSEMLSTTRDQTLSEFQTFFIGFSSDGTNNFGIAESWEQAQEMGRAFSVANSKESAAESPADNVVAQVEMSTMGKMLMNMSSPLVAVGQAAEKVGKMMDSPWATVALTAVELLGGPVKFAVSKAIEVSPIGKFIDEKIGQGMTMMSNFVSKETQGVLSEADATYMVAGGLAVGTLLLSAGKFRKFVTQLPQQMKKLKNYRLALRTDTLNSGIPLKLVKVDGGAGSSVSKLTSSADKGPLLLGPGNPTTRSLSQVRNMRGRERWQAGEQYIQELYGSDGQRHYRVEGTGGRHVDAPVDTNNGGVLANEVKTYQQWKTVDGQPVRSEVPLSPEIRTQIDKDIILRQQNPGFDPRWHFLDAPPSLELRRYLNDNGVIHITY